MITASDITSDRKRLKRLHKVAVERATKEFEACKLDLSDVEREWCLRAIKDDPARAEACYKAIARTI